MNLLKLKNKNFRLTLVDNVFRMEKTKKDFIGDELISFAIKTKYLTPKFVLHHFPMT